MTGVDALAIIVCLVAIATIALFVRWWADENDRARELRRRREGGRSRDSQL